MRFGGGWWGCFAAILVIPLIFVIGAIIAVTIGPYILAVLLALIYLFIIVKIVQIANRLFQKYNKNRKATKAFQARVKRQMQIQANMARIQSKVRGEI